jgi:ATP-binding cassette subfamily B protein
MTRGEGDDDLTGAAFDGRVVRRLLAAMRPYTGSVALTLVLLAFTASTQLAAPLLSRAVIDVAYPAGDATLMAQLAAAYALLLVAQFAAAFAETQLTNRVGQQVMRDLRHEVFAKLQRVPIAFHDRTPVGRMVTRVTSDVEALNELFTSGVVGGLGDLFSVVVIGAVMFFIDWRLALAASIAVPAIAIASRVFQQHVRRTYRETRQRLATLNAFVQERLSGMRVVQLFGEERGEARRFGERNDAHLRSHLASITVYALYFPVVEFFTTLAMATLLLTAANRVAAEALTVGTLAAFLQLLRRFFQPLQDLSENYNILQQAMSSAERVFRLLDAPEDVVVVGTVDAATVASRVNMLRADGVSITFDGIWFRYPSREPEATGDATAWILSDISFHVAPGERLALVGHTGAGKSTIVSLLLRLYEPQRGRILLNGEDIRRIPVEVLRGAIAYVQQDIHLFAGDLADNLRLQRGVDDEALARAAATVGVDRIVARVPSGWQYALGERGAGLSVGERQLLAFARAIVADPAVLVLDEATSAVDTTLEATIQRALASIMRGRTTIAIAHRLSTVVDATIILTLQHGVIVERGTHHALLALGGHYAQLYRLQNARRETGGGASGEAPPRGGSDEPVTVVAQA